MFNFYCFNYLVRSHYCTKMGTKTINNLIVLFREEAFLVESSKPVTSTRDMHQVALGVAQQVVQQWFGDYVTMDSWHNSWLMKGLTEHLKFSIASTIVTVQ